MSYLKHVLQPDEQVLTVGHVHRVVYVKAAFWLVCAIGLAGLYLKLEDYRQIALAAAAVCALIGLLHGIGAWWRRFTTEIAVTSRRVIYKTGFINRYTAEMNMDKVESVAVDQSLLGRLLGYGTVHIRGTGAGIEQLRNIAAPLALRSAIVAR